MADTPSPTAPGGSLHDDTRMILRRRAGLAREPVQVAVSASSAPWVRSVQAGEAGRAGEAGQAAQAVPSAPLPAPPGTAAGTAPAPVWALALSGGGIRSATLSLGVLQAIAATPSPPALASTSDPAPALASTPIPDRAPTSTSIPTPSPSPSPVPAALSLPDPASPAPTPLAGPASPVPPRPLTFDASLLSRIDYLSTVSGGGYVGGFLCSLFIPGRLRPEATTPEAAADDAVQVLCNQPPGRLRANQAFEAGNFAQAPLGWLRDNGRYLSPTGGGDLFYAMSMTLRNWLAVHYVIGTVLVSALALMTLVTALPPALLALDAAHLARALAQLRVPAPGWADGIWWSPLFWPALLVAGAWALPAGLAFWIPAPSRRDGRCPWLNGAFIGYLGALVVLTGGAMVHAHGLRAGAGQLAAQAVDAATSARVAAWGRDWVSGLGQEHVWAVICVVIVLALVQFLFARSESAEVDLLRVRLTQWLSTALLFTCGLLALAVVDTLARTMYLALAVGHGTLPDAMKPAGAAAALVWIVRRLALASEGLARPGWLAGLPWELIGGAVGVLIMVLVATFWALAVVALQWLGRMPDPALLGAPQRLLLGTLCLVAFLLAWIVGRFPSFINLSSLQSFYSARLTRAYLGASNGARFRAGTRLQASVAEPDAGDPVQLADFITADTGADGQPELKTRAPLHLINVTVNDTVDPAEQLVQRDRKGLPLVAMPLGFSVDGGPLQRFLVRTPRVELQRTLSLGQWIGTSGAALATGIGRETSLGLSLLMAVANVRLGTWWESGAGDGSRAGRLARLAETLLRTQSYLFSEFTAKFHGFNRRWQYLSDGGHFENTALYELLRPSRGVRLVFACDHGADPHFRFGDLANLIRLARIDMQLELRVEADVGQDPLLRPWFGVPADFRSPSSTALDVAAGLPAVPAPGPAGTTRETPVREPVALLLRACQGQPSSRDAWVVLLKPRVRTDSAADVVQYALSHPSFPHESTADQSFDEAQWESYRKLGHDNASHLFAPPVFAALQAYIARGGPPPADMVQ